MSPSTGYKLTDLAYSKLIVHALKHPHAAVNGVLLGTAQPGGKTVDIVDAVPLLHHWVNLSPMMELGLEKVALHAETRGLAIVGFYHAWERVDEAALSPVGERVAAKLKESFPDAVALVIVGAKLGKDDDHALVPYTSISATTFRPAQSSVLHVTPGLPSRIVDIVRNTYVHEDFKDFDDYLEDVHVDYLHNTAVTKVLSVS
ncbi:UPF0172-domain-containing protein [Auriscalpium vulgare]|uniref:UPF0172-domain-containing protein n=1 Tax=Auriscalpium vulgare TaxID=40419 RepID=A0ACB8S8G3_9AGAM|nr:UPF0172-domain-containing protein [Auriscalpium vulgare]